MKASRTGLNLCSGANLPAGSHHSAAMAENLATSAVDDAHALSYQMRTRPSPGLGSGGWFGPRIVMPVRRQPVVDRLIRVRLSR